MSTDVEELVQLLLTQDGGRYQFGGKVAGSVADPKAEDLGMDCSGFIAWATTRLGHPLIGGSWQQLDSCREAGLSLAVSTAISTRGALLFIPANGTDHVALSLGNGYTIEAHDTADGIGSWPAAGRFSAAAKIPGFTYGTTWSPPPVPTEWSLDMQTIDLSNPTKIVTGPEIRALQMLLNLGISLSHVGRPLAVDGQAGPDTRAALGNFQRVHELAVDYIAGGVVWEALCSQ
jgi:peptidoglycan hydrolase-like protein with peptidoglycan-binding domain